MMVLATFIYVFWGLSPCQAEKLTDNRIEAIQANIHNSTNFSTKCLELPNNAEQNRTAALSTVSADRDSALERIGDSCRRVPAYKRCPAIAIG
jgi:hypothetical protein